MKNVASSNNTNKDSSITTNKKINSSELDDPLPCPFCGTKPTVLQRKCVEMGYLIECHGLNCHINIRTYMGQTKKEVIKMWNKRYQNH